MTLIYNSIVQETKIRDSLYEKWLCFFSGWTDRIPMDFSKLLWTKQQIRSPGRHWVWRKRESSADWHMAEGMGIPSLKFERRKINTFVIYDDAIWRTFSSQIFWYYNYVKDSIRRGCHRQFGVFSDCWVCHIQNLLTYGCKRKTTICQEVILMKK